MAPPPPPPSEEDHSLGPSNHKLISVYLRRRVAGEPLPLTSGIYFHELDIYTADPATLTKGIMPVPARNGEGSYWLFFTPVRCKSSKDKRKSRMVGGGIGTWHSEHAPEAVVDEAGNPVGHRQLFSYKAKGFQLSRWSMWEFTAADQERGDSLLVLCKMHEGHAVRSARKRKAAEDCLDQAGSAPVRRRLFVPTAPAALPSTLQVKIDATSEAIACSKTEIEASKDRVISAVSILEEPVTSQEKIGVQSEIVPVSMSETEVSKDTLMSVISICNQPVASQDQIGSASEVTPSSRIETEVSKDTARSVLSFWDQPATSQDLILASLRTGRSLSPKPDASQENFFSSMGSPARARSSFLFPEPEASQSMGMATFDSGFFTDSGTPSAPEHCCQESFTFIDNSGSNMSGRPVHALDAGICDAWTEYDMTGSCSDGNRTFLGGLPTYNDNGATVSGSSTGYNTTTASWSVGDSFFDDFLAHNDPGISGYAGVPYGCGVPQSAALLPSAAPSQWCSAPSLWTC